MSRLGMLIDLSHVSYRTMVEVLDSTDQKMPVIFSHSSAYALLKHYRNVPGGILRAVAKNGVVVMVTFRLHVPGCRKSIFSGYSQGC